ncbi:hypothetical protein RclHR1_05180008 [Rhizophagus clarus]|uniref:F-box domain-containing protein n=1 Tax=Rhizophagus clarus TaxID=94130 RepID=A0A2Z6RMS4_9GLOM|nr:hypothetical protein RclHR1_05180008 [Rhizophagus clarus]GES82839.1 hypothetical protein GLOIN_2v1591804 [Rhizophagus clarus]
MPCQLPTDCLNEIFEYLEEDKITLRSCILVNRLWCEIAVRILWRNIWSFQYSVHYNPYRTHVPLAIISTLIACLPDESKNHLYKNGIFIATPTYKPSLFNYASFCKVLSIYEIDKMIQHVLENQRSITSRSLSYNKYLLSQEILKMFMNEISSLKFLEYDSGYSKKVQNVMFTYFPEAKNCLKGLPELKCSSDIYSEFFYQLSQICHNIRSLTIEFGDVISNGLTDLISLQNNLKSVTLIYYSNEGENGMDIITSLTKFSRTLTKLKIKESYIPLLFISKFINLQELIFSLELSGFDDFNHLHDFAFSQLKILKFLYAIPKVEMLIRFLKINGKNLKELYIGEYDSSLNSIIAKFCPNLKSLSTIFLEEEIGTLKLILNNCQYLENINVWCSDGYLNEKESFEIFSKHSPKNFYGLEIFYAYKARSEIPSEELEKFFINWKNRVPQKPLSLIVIKSYDCISLELKGENMKIIERYIDMGVIKKFKTKKFEED